MRRGDVWWAQLPAPAGRRPVVLVSRDAAYAVRSSVTVAEVSTRVRAIKSEVALGKRDGLPRRCVVNTDNLATIPKTWLETRIAGLSSERMKAIDDALVFSLGLPSP